MFCVRYVKDHLPFGTFPWNTDVAVAGLFFFCVGFKSHRILRYIMGLSGVLLSTLCTILISLLAIAATMPIENWGTLRAYSDIPFSYLAALLGIGGVIAFSRLCECKFGRSSMFEYISSNTLTVFAIHWPLMWNIHRIEKYLHFSCVSWIKSNCVLYAAFLLAFSLVIAAAINRYIPFVLGRASAWSPTARVPSQGMSRS